MGYPGRRDRWGYVRIKSGGRRGYAHRMAYERANGPIPEGMVVCHHCDNRVCVNVEHLFVGTQADNMRDMTAKGRRVRGATHGMSKVTEADIPAIRSLRASGVGLAEIADRFSVSITTVSRIALRRTWVHVP